MGTVIPRFSIIVPVRNGASRLSELIGVLDDLSAPSAELVLIDDGSVDESWKVIHRYSNRRSHNLIPVRGIRLDRGRGQQSALLTALTTCRNRPVITMDDDLAHPAETILRLLEALENGADLAYADPPRRPGSALRSLASRIHQIHLSLITGSSIAVRVGSYRSMSSGLIDRILSEPVTFPYISAQALALRPAPRAVMVGSAEWNTGAHGRFPIAQLLKLEYRLAAAYGPPGRLKFRRKRSITSAAQTAAGWIAEVTSQ